MTKRITASALAIALSFSIFGTTQAASLTSDVNVGVGTSGSANSNTNSDVSNTSANSNSQSTSTVNMGVGAMSENSTTNSVSSFSLSRSDVSADISDNANVGLGANTNSSETSVNSDDTLKAYIMTALRSDENLNDVSASETALELHYKQPSYFLGFIPSRMNTQVSVNSEGAVSLSYPWYSFLMKTDRSSADLQTALSASVANNTSMSVKGSASYWAQVFSHIFNTLRNDVSAESEVNAEGSVSGN